MQITITLTGDTPAAHAKTLRNYANMFEGNTKSAVPSSKKAKPATEEVEEELDTTDEDTIDDSVDVEEIADESSEDEAVEETEEVEEEETQPAKKAAPAAKPQGLTLQKHIIPAFQKYAKKYSREKAGKVLAKYKVKNVNELPQGKFPEVLKILNA